jgi:hypothetical protein
MTSVLRRTYLLSVLDALAAYASNGGEIHFASLNDGGKLAITFTLEDGDAYNQHVSVLFNERFEGHQPASDSAQDELP